MMDFFHFFFPRRGKKPGRQPEKKTGDRPADRTPVPPEEKTEHKQEHAPRREPQIMESVSPVAEPEIEPWEENARMTYTDCERRVIQHYIHDAFGPIGRTYYDGDRENMKVDIVVCEPTEERRYYTLATVGMGARRMRVPKAMEERNVAFAELSVCLPPDWDLMNDTWPFHMLKAMAHFPFRSHDMIGVGNAYHGSITRGSDFAGAFVIPAATQDRISTRLMLPDGRIVNYYLLLPLYEDEWEYLTSRHDAAAFWERYSERIGSIVVDPERESCIYDLDRDEDDEWNI